MTLSDLEWIFHASHTISSMVAELLVLLCYVEDADNFEPKDVRPAPRDQWDGEDEEEDTAFVRASLQSLKIRFAFVLFHTWKHCRLQRSGL